MFETITPEKAGISSRVVADFIDALENCGAHTHGFLFMRDCKIFAEGYYKPFDKDFCHRMYSQTKSFVGVAIGLLEEEGKLSLDDKIADYFPDKKDGELPRFLESQTIKDMLTMTTIGESPWWFASDDPDRVHQYFNSKRRTSRPPGTLWEYDSAGSQVLCVLVERLSGKTLLAYLKEKLFDKIGFFKNARTLKTPNGDTWGDSSLICTLRDMAAFGQLVMNYGTWNGKRLMNERYLRDATSGIVDNSDGAYYSGYAFGYGYQIWRVGGNGFAFVGMGDQLTVCYPDKNLLFTCVSDNQGTTLPREVIFAQLRDYVLPAVSDAPLGDDPAEYNRLKNKIDGLTLKCVTGQKDSPWRDKINGVKYVCEENDMGITEFAFRFSDEKEGEFVFINGQGEKTIPFGVNHNVFGHLPQYGYSREVGREKTTDGFTYKDAVSLAWLQDNKIVLNVQIIDDYFGNMSAVFAFKDDCVSATFASAAENFLTEYRGWLFAKRINRRE